MALKILDEVPCVVVVFLPSDVSMSARCASVIERSISSRRTKMALANKMRLDFLVQDKTSGILKAPTNRLSYKDIKLSNGLRCILISDPKSDEDSKTTDESEPSENEIGSEGSKDTNSKDDGSNTDEIEAAAAMCVNVGSLEDPKEVQGMAHLMEHVITMGSAKYPEENGFDTFLGNVAGQSNASTCVMQTIYDFEVSFYVQRTQS